MNVELALDCRCELGEGPIWDDRIGRLLFVDIEGHTVHSFDPISRVHETFDFGERVSAIALNDAAGYVVTLQHDFAFFDFDRGAFVRLAAVEADRADTRFNDGYVDPRGRFWAGTLSLVRKPQQGALYRFDRAPEVARPFPPSPKALADRRSFSGGGRARDGVAQTSGYRVTKMLDGVTNSNGIDWSGDGRLMYYVDTGTRRIDVFDFDLDAGTIANRSTFAAIPESEGKPDGLILDEEGFVWVALWQGAAVRRYAADGRIDTQIDLPVSCPTKCAFGGPNLDELYITTARAGLTEEQREFEPHAGSVFVTKPGIRGRAPNRFA